MNRRDALKYTGVILGSSLIGAEAFLSGCVNKKKYFVLTLDDITFLNDFAEIILPANNTPGAKEADVANFMDTIVTDFYSTKEQKIFQDGIVYVNSLSKTKFGSIFFSLSSENKNALLINLENEAKAHYRSQEAGEHFYIMFKQLTIWGYLSSEIVAKKAFIHAPLIANYIGTIDYKPGDKIIYNDYGHSGSAYNTAMHFIKSV